MLTLIYVLVVAAAACFTVGIIVRFVRHHEATVWWRGAMGLLAFANTLLLLEIYRVLTGPVPR